MEQPNEHRFFAPGTPFREDYPGSWLERWLARRFWREEIPKRVDRSKLYLRRFILCGDHWAALVLRWLWFRVYLHVFYASDDDPDPHDHPADYLTVVLWGGYWDETWSRARQVIRRVLMFPGRIARRRAEHIHRAHLLGTRAWTLFFFGRRRRDWFFWTVDGPIYWEDYLKLKRKG